MVELGPDVLLASAERIKHALARELKISLAGGEKIHLFLTPHTQANEDFTIKPSLYAGAWQYRVNIPDRIEGLRVIRGIVNVLLLELANRGAGSKSAEIPLWLVEGLSLRLFASVGPSLILESVPTGSMARTVSEVRGIESLREARDFLRSHRALTFAELNHPTLEQLSGSNLKLFQHSAQVFLNELCRLPDGQASLLRMMRELPYCWNCETAFLRAFQARFQRLLDVEKWWSVNLSVLTGRGSMQAWSAEGCLEKLHDLLSPVVQVRSASNTLPVRTRMTLQQAIADLEFSLQRPVLRQILNQLLSLRYSAQAEMLALIERYRAVPHNRNSSTDKGQIAIPVDVMAQETLRDLDQVIALIDRYRITLHNYLQKRGQAGYSSADKRQGAVPVNFLVQDTMRELDQLYRDRETLRRAQLSAATTPSRR